MAQPFDRYSSMPPWLRFLFKTVFSLFMPPFENWFIILFLRKNGNVLVCFPMETKTKLLMGCFFASSLFFYFLSISVDCADVYQKNIRRGQKIGQKRRTLMSRAPGWCTKVISWCLSSQLKSPLLFRRPLLRIGSTHLFVFQGRTKADNFQVKGKENKGNEGRAERR